MSGDPEQPGFIVIKLFFSSSLAFSLDTLESLKMVSLLVSQTLAVKASSLILDLG
jgi:hypothetical protein